ncbi:hypothetical protein D9758_003549 [Tetrapyrgos nigripes]|uniref:P-loop containing nucleoside triphosphate hydrolase protein n=1 Tax=Tetrapyrgos nigripes TaxID=182062 RepID=A0A8H5GVG8_9AGAR|nr:hypothetical protein D9758_003549 [Tetrapyrgos nigripes]
MSTRALSSLPLPPSTLAVLKESGYETLGDLKCYQSPDQLTDGKPLAPILLSLDDDKGYTKALKIPLSASQSLFSATQDPSRTGASSSASPLTQSLASIVSSRKRSLDVIATQCSPVDSLLNGGLRRGHILEISGPPGSPKELIAKGIMNSFIMAGEEVLFVDCQNATNPASLDELLKNPRHRRLVSYVEMHTLPELMIFFNNTTNYLASRPNIALIVLNSISFPFLNAFTLKKSAKSVLLEQIKQKLLKLCTNRNMTIVSTTQLSTKLIKPDGSSGSFDTEGARGMMMAPFGAAYLPPGRSYRLQVTLDMGRSGTLRLLSSPNTRTKPSGDGNRKDQPRQMVNQNVIIKQRFLLGNGNLISLNEVA